MGLSGKTALLFAGWKPRALPYSISGNPSLYDIEALRITAGQISRGIQAEYSRGQIFRKSLSSGRHARSGDKGGYTHSLNGNEYSPTKNSRIEFWEKVLMRSRSPAQYSRPKERSLRAEWTKCIAVSWFANQLLDLGGEVPFDMAQKLASDFKDSVQGLKSISVDHSSESSERHIAIELGSLSDHDPSIMNQAIRFGLGPLAALSASSLTQPPPWIKAIRDFDHAIEDCFCRNVNGPSSSLQA